MQYRQLGRSGLRVSCLGLGTHMNIGHSLDERASKELVRTAYEAGVNLVDTADTYTEGAAERMLGVCIADTARSDWVILTKVWGEMGPGPNDQGLSAKHIREGCDASLQRLGLEYVDIYMCHNVDPITPIEEVVRPMGDLIRAGKALYWGVSNWSADMVVQANAIARAMAMPVMTACEDRYNLLYRSPEATLFPAYLEQGIGTVTFSPLAHGMLAGVYKPGETVPPPGTRAALDPTNKVTRMYYREEHRQKAGELVAMAEHMGTTAATLATAWCCIHPAVSSVLIGAWNVDELRNNLKAADLEIPPEILQKLDELFPGLPQSAGF